MNSQLQVVVPQNPSIENGRTMLFISELPENISEVELDTFFADFKESMAHIMINKSNPKADLYSQRTTATIIFKDHRRADEARKNLNLRKIRGKTIRIMWHEKDNSIRYGTQGNLFIKNVSAEVKPREFYEKFLQYGDIVSAKLGEDEEGNHYGYGYVSYYNPESAEAAIRALNDKEIWDGQKLEVQRFQRKNERFSSLTVNKNLYVKNLPERFTEDKLKSLFNKYGTITWAKLMTDSNERKSAIISYDSEEAVNKAREGLNGTIQDGQELYVDSLMKKSDRKKILSTRITDNNYKLNSQFKNCNLHLRNLPYDAEETHLHDVFTKFGEVKSVKIPKFLLVTKVNGQLKEIPMSKGFGYVCFVEQDAARKAIEEMNGKFLPNFENVKRPILVDFFMPKYERKQMLNRLQIQAPGKAYPFMNPYGAQMGIPFNMHPNLAKHVRNPVYSNPQTKQPRNFMTPQQVAVKPDDPDIKYLNSLEDDAARRDYLGEFIFKRIENHPYAQSHTFTIDTIGKITGMILGIQDISEIVDITINNDNLTARISEALGLLEKSG
jgi:polyadenylate-binding protein